MTKLSVIGALAMLAFAAAPGAGLARGANEIRLEVSAVILPRISCGGVDSRDRRRTGADPCISNARAAYRVRREHRRPGGDAEVDRGARGGVMILTIEP